MSYEIVREDGSGDQFASNSGYAQLVEAGSKHPALKNLFDAGESEDVEGIAAALALIKSPADAASTAKGLAKIIRGAKSILITDGLTGEEGIEKGDKTFESWIGVDLDGTLATHTESFDPKEIGSPVPAMVDRVRAWLAEGKTVKIFTARVADDPDGEIKRMIQAYALKHVGRELEVTCEKDPGMTELWDDKAHGVVEDTGIEKAGSGVLVAFWLDSKTAKKLAVVGGESPADMHVTLAYFGKVGEVSSEQVKEIETIVADFAAQHGPVSGKLAGPERFSATSHSDGKDVIYAAFESDEVQEFRRALVDAFDERDLHPKSDFEYHPHATLEYVAAGERTSVDEVSVPATFDAVALKIGADVKTFLLEGKGVEKGGPGSGCHGDNCGRPSKGMLSKKSQDAAIEKTKAQLKMVSDLTGGKGTDGFVLKNGEPFRMNERSFDGARMTEKLCYMNAYQTAMGDEKMQYVEGYVHIGPFAIHHAWNADEKGNVVDKTLKPTAGKVGPRGYFGVRIGKDYLLKTAMKTKVYGVISHTNRSLFEGDDFKKYSDDQPRDERGRWTSGGGGGEGEAAPREKSQEERIHDVLERSDNDPLVHAAERAMMEVQDSRMAPGVLDSSGHYTPEAHAENQRIAEKFLNHAARSDSPKAIFLLGKPGSGKTTVVNGMSMGNVTHINSDLIKEALPGYVPANAAAFHERSCDIARNYLTPEAVRLGHNVVFDMTDNQERLMGAMRGLQSLGYKIGVIHVHVDTATSLERAYGRFHTSGRYVPLRVVQSYGEKPKMAFEAGKKLADQWKEYDNTSRPPRLLDSGGGGLF